MEEVNQELGRGKIKKGQRKNFFHYIEDFNESLLSSNL